MAPENTTNTTENTRQTVAVPAPEAGEAVAVRSAAGAELNLGFNPSDAIISRDGNSLVFEFDDGGTVTLVNFFAVGDEPLPDFRMPDGVLVASLDFFQGSDIDVSTAAGPGAAPGSGVGAYDGDPGAFTDGVDRLGDQGTFYWGRGVEVDREDEGYGLAGGSFGMNAVTFGEVLAYEDGRPFQHMDNPPAGEVDFNPARLEFLPEPLPGNSVNEVRISGLPEGAKLLRPDGQGGYEEILPGTDGVYRLQEADFLDPSGVYIVPPTNSDDDFTLTVNVDFNYNGLITTVNGTVEVIVDAVADRPEDVATDQVYGHGDVAYEGGTPGKINVQAEFNDYNDNSETHYIVIYKGDVIDNVDPASLPDGMSLLSPGEAAQFGSNTGVEGEFWVIEVSNEYLQEHGGKVDVEVGVAIKDYTTDQTGLIVDTEAVAVEYDGYNTVTSPSEAYAENNVSRVPGQAEVNVSVVSSEIEVGVSTPAYEDNMAEAHRGLADQHEGAQIKLSGLATEDNESVTRIELTIECQQDAASGEYVGGTFLYNGVEYEVVPGPDGKGTVVMIFPDAKGGEFDQDAPIYYQPGQSNSDADIDLTYAVTVHDSNLSTAHDKVFTNDAAREGLDNTYFNDKPLTIEVDAVADQAKNVDANDAYADGDEAYEGGTTGNIAVTATFDDYHDNSESHYIIIYKGDVVTDVDGNSLSDGLTLLTGEAAAEFAANSGIDPNEAGEYWVIEVSAEYLQANNGIVNEEVGVTIKNQETDRLAENEDALRVDTEAVAIEHSGLNTVAGQGGVDGEERADNNVSRVPGHADVNVSVISSEIEVGVSTPAYEDNMAEAHLGKDDQHEGAQINLSGLATDDNESVTRIELTIECQYNEGTGEYVGGTFIYNGVEYPVTPDVNGKGTVVMTFPDAKDGEFDQDAPIFYQPGPSNSDADINLNYAVTVHDSNLSTAHDKVFTNDAARNGQDNTYFNDKPLTIVVDAVADQAKNVVTTEKYGDDASSYVAGETGEIVIRAEFDDYHDGSESHYIVIYKDGAIADFDGAQLPAGLEVLIGQDAADFASNTGIGGEYWVIKVTDDYLKDSAHEGKVNITVEVEISDEFTKDSPSTIKTSAVSVEHQGKNTPLDGSGGIDGETDAENNVSIVTKVVDVNVGTITSDIKVEVGSAFEDNLPNAHTGSDAPGAGAAINVLGLADSITEHESISEAVFTITCPKDAATGQYVPGQFLYDGKPCTVTGPDGEGHLTVTINDFDPSKSFVYQPGPSNSDTDIDLTYKITVHDSSLNKDKVFTNDKSLEGEPHTVVSDAATTIVVDAVADQAKGVVTGEVYGDKNSYVAGAAGEVNIQAIFDDYHDGSESHYIVIYKGGAVADITGLPDGMNLLADNSDFASNSGLSGDYWVIEVTSDYLKEHQGKVDENIGVKIRDAANDTTDVIKTAAVSMEHEGLNTSTTGSLGASGGETDAKNNVSIVPKEIEVNLGEIRSDMKLGDGRVVEDDRPMSYEGDDTTRAGGAVLNVTGFVTGDNEVISEFTFTYTAPKSYDADGNVTYVPGTFTHDGQTCTMVGPDPITGEVTVTVENFNPNAPTLTYTPGQSNSDVDLNLEYKITVTDSKLGDKVFEGTAKIEVDSVADQADIEGTGKDGKLEIKPDLVDGRYVVKAADGVAETDDKGNETGWFVSTADNTTPVSCSVDLAATFKDLDGSEFGMVLIECLEGVTVLNPDGSGTPCPTWIDPVSGKEYFIVAEGPVGRSDNPDVKPLTSGDIKINLEISNTEGKENPLENLNVYVRTQEQNANPGETYNDKTNDISWNQVDGQISLAWLAEAVEVKTGWVYEDGNGGKYNPDGTHSFTGGEGYESTSTSAIGAPVEITVNENVTQVILNFNPNQGTFLINGEPLNPNAFEGPLSDGSYNLVINSNAFDQLDKLTFKPDTSSPNYSDTDIELKYTIKAENGGDKFQIEGKTSIVVDAVADLAKVSMGEAEAANDDVNSVLISIEANFPDSAPGDTSEAHYILVEAKEGWSVEGAGEPVSVMVDKVTGNPVYPTGHDGTDYTWPANSEAKMFYKVDAVNGQNNIKLVPDSAEGNKDFTVKTVVVSEEVEVNGHEYDYSNNFAYVVNDVKVDLIDSKLTLDVKGVYEDHLPKGNEAGIANQTPTPTPALVIGLDQSAGSEDKIDLSDGNTITITFNYEGKGDIKEGGFEVNGKKFGLDDVVKNGDGSYTVKLPTDDIPEKGGQLEIIYNPPKNDDSDLTGVKVGVPVVSGSGEEGTRWAGGEDGVKIIVDAVADLTSHEVAKGDITNEAHEGDKFDAITWGSKVEITVTGTYNDLDGSENHYVLVQRPSPNWTCDNADGVINIGGVDYFYVKVDSGTGEGGHKFVLQAPDKTEGGLSDGPLNIKTGSMAVEGKIVTGKDGKGEYEYVDKDDKPLVEGTNEITTGNNVSFTPGQTSVNVDIVNGAKGTKTNAFEDNQDKQYLGQDTHAAGGLLTITTDDPISINGDHTIPGVISFTYTSEGNPDAAPGDFTFTVKVNGVNTEFTVPAVENPVGSGKYTVDIPVQAAGNKDFTVQYNPPLNDSTDLKDLNFTVDVKSPASGETGTISNVKIGDGTLVVDAVADRPNMDVDLTEKDGHLGKEYQYEPGKDAGGKDIEAGAKPNEKVTITIKDVEFSDYKDGSESHYLLVQQTGVKASTQTGVSAPAQNLADLADQTITINAYAEGKVVATQTITISGGKATVTITADGFSKTYDLDATEYKNLVEGSKVANNSYGDNNEYFYIPVDNEFLQAAEKNAPNGEFTVSGGVEVAMPGKAVEVDGKQVDSTYTINAGALAVENETDAGRADLPQNNVGMNVGEVVVKVDVVTSDFGVKLNSDHVYENGKPLNYLDPNSLGENDSRFGHTDSVGGFQYLRDDKGNVTSTVFKPLFDGDGKVIVENLKFAGAEIEFSGLDNGENASVTLTMTPQVPAYSGPGEAPVDYYGTVYDAQGNPHYFDANGKCTIDLTGTGSDQSAYFVPGPNFSSNDIKLGWEATVTDTASGAEKDFGSKKGEELGVVVDSVANAADLGNLETNVKVDGNEFNQLGDVFYGKGHGSLNLEIKVGFEDFDGSEKHYVLVEAQKGMDLSDAFKAAFPKGYFEDSNNMYYEFDANGEVVRAYYKIPVDGVSADNPYITVSGSGDQREVTVNVGLEIKGSDGQEISIGSGAMTVEYDPDKQIGEYYDKAGNLVTEKQSESKINDVSVVKNDPINVVISEATVKGGAATVVVSESGDPQMHGVDNNDGSVPTGGVDLRPNFVGGNTGGVQDEIIEVKISWASEDNDRGVVEYYDSTLGKMVTVENGGSVPYKDIGSLTYTPASGKYDDSDISIKYTVTAKDPQSNDVHDTVFEQKIVFDAVAQKPVAKGVEYEEGSGGKVHQDFSHSNQRVHNEIELKVEFTDVTDGSTRHYVLVECKAGWNVNYPAENPDPSLVTKVQAPDGTWYFKVDVTDQVAEQVKDGNYDSLKDSASISVEVDLVAPAKVYGDRWFNSNTGEVSTTEQTGEGWTLLPGNGPSGYVDGPNGSNGEGTLNYGGMSHDQTSGDGEVRWNNNWAFDVDGQIDVEYKHGCSGGWEIEAYAPAFENDTPLAHTGNETPMGGAQISFLGGAAGEKEYTYDYDESRGILEVRDASGNVVETIGDGDSYALKDGESLYFVPSKDANGIYNKDYDDTDVQITVSGPNVPTSDNSWSFWVTIDAVAQIPEVDNAGITNGNLWTDPSSHVEKLYTNESVDVIFKVSFADTDGSEEHFVLVAQNQNPAIEIPGAEMIMVYTEVDGKSVGEVYYKLPVEYDKDSDSYVAKATVVAKDGEADYTIKYGVGSIEHPKDGEVWSENNTAIKLDEGSLEFTVALANTSVSMTPVVEVEENIKPDDMHSYNTGMLISVGDHDVVDSITIKVSPADGKLTIGGIEVDVKGGSVTISSDPGDPNYDSRFDKFFEDLNAKAGGDPANVDLEYTPALYENRDVTITADVEAHDVRSLDNGKDDSKNLAEIDALAIKPEVIDMDGIDNNVNTGEYKAVGESAKVGEEITVKMTVKFGDIDPTGKDATPEHHYILVESKANWGYPEADGKVPFEKTYDKDRVEFFKVPVDDAISECYKTQGEDGRAANVGFYHDDALGISYTVTFNADGTATVQVEMPLTLPDLALKGDYTYELKYGGQSVDTPYPDSNASIYNDVSYNTSGTVTIDVGVVEAREGDVAAKGDAVNENQKGGTNEIEIVFTADANNKDTNDVVETIYIKPSDVKNGELLVNGSAPELVNDQYKIPGGATVTFKPNEYWSGEYDIPFTATVVDGKSGAGNNITYNGKISVDVESVASDAQNIIGSDPAKAVNTNTNVSFEVRATFSDMDDSEQHFVLVQKLDDTWGNPRNYGTYTDPETNDVYYKVPVTSYVKDPVTGEMYGKATVTIKTPSGVKADSDYNLKVGALTHERDHGNDTSKDNAVFENDANDTVTVKVGVVEANKITLTIDSPMQEDGKTPISVELSGGHNDSLSSFTILLPAGSSIVDSSGKAIASNTYSYDRNVTISNADYLKGLQDGDYFYKPGANVSGEQSLTYSGVAKDNASGVTKPITGEAAIKVDISGVTDAATAQNHTGYGEAELAGHHANVSVTLTAKYGDTTGTEDHFFLVKLPAGAEIVSPAASNWKEVTDPALKAAAGFNTGDKVYQLDTNDKAADVSQAITVKVPENYDGNIEYAAGSYERDAAPNYDYQFIKDGGGNVIKGEVAIDTDGINKAPDIVNGSASVADTLRNPEAGAGGYVSLKGGSVNGTDMRDADNDVVTINNVTGSGATTSNETSFMVQGQYGYLTVNKATGQYEYTLNEGANPPHGYQEKFNVSVIDSGYSGTQVSDTAQITINLNAPNSAPTASGTLTINAGNVSEDALSLVPGNMGLKDAHNDDITITKVAGADANAEGYFEVQGQYGVLRVYADGKYDYRLTNEFATGKETFKVDFQDEHGAKNSANITVNVKPVWHAPEVGEMENSFDGTGGYIMGQLSYSDPDGGKLSVTVIGSDGRPYSMPASGTVDIPAEHGILTLYSDGSYVYTATDRHEAAAANDWESFVVKVTDGTNLSDSGLLNIALGNPTEPAPVLADGGKTLDQSGAAESVTIAGSEGSDTIFGSNYGDIINAGAGNDIVNGGSGDDLIYGGSGNDILNGGAGNDVIYGGSGNDIINGGAGNDIMSGGSGDDIFVWKSGDIGTEAGGTPFHDIIVDFSMQGAGIENGLLGNDKIDLSELLPKGANVSEHVSISASDDGKSAILSISAAANGDVVQTIELQGVYETHATGNDSYEAVNAMIMQHIITNS